MVKNHIIRQVTGDRWNRAQKFELEFAKTTIESDDDWNFWWYQKFNKYSILERQHFDNVLEVGCGPHTNIRYILPLITFKKIWLEDPLIQYYLSYNLKKLESFYRCIRMKFFKKKVNYLLTIYSNLNYPVDLSSSKFEDLPYRDHLMDLVICINVLDHINDYDQRMKEIHRVMNTNGVLIIGQDLSNSKDLEQCPESYRDIGHPIKLDHPTIEKSLEGKYHFLFKKILPRGEGRNPDAHYGTFLAILKKTM